MPRGRARARRRGRASGDRFASARRASNPGFAVRSFVCLPLDGHPDQQGYGRRSGSVHEPRKGSARIIRVMAETRAALATEDGVRAVYAAHGGELFRFALRSLNDRGLAEEAVQEAFVRAWQAA